MRYISVIIILLISCTSKGQYDEIIKLADNINSEGKYVEAIELYNKAEKVRNNDEILNLDSETPHTTLVTIAI